MHPDKRRAGRAIRKQRRIEREQLQSFDIEAAARALGVLAESAARGIALMCEAFAALGRAANEAIQAVDISQHQLWESERPKAGTKNPT